MNEINRIDDIWERAGVSFFLFFFFIEIFFSLLQGDKMIKLICLDHDL